MPEKTVQPGDTFSQTFIVQPQQTALALGSGQLEVFSTPAMIACMENTAMKLLSTTLDKESSSVGVEINARHIKASPVGETIAFTATVKSVQGRSVEFEITAVNQKGICIGTATHIRVIIDIERFMAKLNNQ
ncbi:MAG TPA: thioesterase family protein [Chitinispirillaceae bacterium]|nr:thioesterase family protein [Chitinispirillaceae bacterium]